MKKQHILKMIQCISLISFIGSVIAILSILKVYYLGEKEYNKLERIAVHRTGSIESRNSEFDIEEDSIRVCPSKNNENEHIDDIDDEQEKIDYLENGDGEINIFECLVDLYQIDYELLQSINEDYIGYIVIPDTEISYPIVQGKDNSYYLNHTFQREKNKNGCLFVDVKCERALIDLQTIIYGHHMKNDAMFGALDQYKEYRYWEEHPYIVVYDKEGYSIYEIYSVYVDDAYDLMVKRQVDEIFKWNQEIKWNETEDSNNIEQQKEWIREYTDIYQKKSIHNINLDDKYVENEQLTLITCDYSTNHSRLIVHATKVYEDSN